MTPRLKSLLVRDFRSISGEWLVPLDAEVVLIHGQNGAGKTSLLSALELAATGKISYLDRLGDADYRNHLNHRGTRSGEVRLETTGLAERSAGSAMLTARGSDCNPLLNDQLAEKFVERSFLPQATLSRLFEVYAPRKDASDTPLIRFVKEVLGLDALDALIDGLYPAGDIRRVQKSSARWKDASANLADLAARRRDLAQTRQDLESRLVALSAETSDVNAENISEEATDSSRLDELRTLQSINDSTAAELRSLLLRLESVESALTEENLINVDPNEDDTIASDLVLAEGRYHEWKASRSAPLVEWFSSAENRSGPISDPDPSELLRALRLALSSAESELERAERKLAEIEAFDAKLINARSRILEIDDELAHLNATTASISGTSAAASLASALVLILEHVNSDVCPVCDQDFNRAEPLRAHISSKVEGLNASAVQLVELETLRTRLEAERKALVREIAEDEAVRDRAGDPRGLGREVQANAKMVSYLKALEPLGEAGLTLWDALERVRDVHKDSTRRRKMLERCLADLDEVAAILGVSAPRGLLAQQVASLRAKARGRLDEVVAADRKVSESMRRFDESASLVAQLRRVNASLVEVDGLLAQLNAQIDEATRRKEFAANLRKRAEELRGATITRVFNDQLNGSWSRIFTALVPSEPFIPQFRKMPPEVRRVRIDIETRHRDGLEGATPAAMLSQGNLNTAALSLFIALHFAVPPRLPWLIFDDPVQSMDDLHISNFASLVKQLTRRNGRQVVIAVHDRELFDYLSLELSPASANEQLLAIVLDRTYGQSVITHDRLTYVEDTSLSPSPAA